MADPGLAGRQPDACAVAPLADRGGDSPIALREANLRGARLAGARLRDADLQRCVLVCADLSGADLRGARLGRADLTLADLRGADLSGADLSQADLSGADLRGAQLSGADFADAELAWCRVAGALGAPDAWLQLETRDGRIAGDAGQDGEPAAAMRAYARGQAAWQQGRIFAAERHLQEAHAWVPDADVTLWHLGALSLERGDPLQAEAHWRQAVSAYERADRARLDLALLQWAQGKRAAAQETLNVERPVWFHDVADMLARHDDFALDQLLHAKVGKTPGLTWLRRPAPGKSAPSSGPEDPLWADAERLDLDTMLRDPRQPAWVWHGAIARALALGDLGLAQRADQRLRAVAPEHRLWSLELKHLDMTAEAFAELVRTRAEHLGPITSLRWVALGAHGPTARITCEAGVFYAKRYDGQTRSAASVAYTHRVSRGLRDRGLTVPAALADRDGDDVLVFGADLLALYPQVGGRPVDGDQLTDRDAYRLGETLARVHVQGAELAAGGRPRGGVRSGSRIVRGDQARATWLAALGRDAACMAEFQRFSGSGLLLDLLEATSRRLASVAADCPLGLTHGDLAGGNALETLDGRGGVAIVDWDLCDADLLVWDLARTLDLIGVAWPDDPAQPEEFRPSTLRAAVSGYTSVRPLRRAEQLALPVLIAASRVDLDASVAPLCVRLEPGMGPPIWQRQLARLSRAAAGAPELADVFAPVWTGDCLHSPAGTP